MPRNKSAAVTALHIFLNQDSWLLPHGDIRLAKDMADTVV